MNIGNTENKINFGDNIIGNPQTNNLKNNINGSNGILGSGIQSPKSSMNNGVSDRGINNLENNSNSIGMSSNFGNSNMNMNPNFGNSNMNMNSNLSNFGNNGVSDRGISNLENSSNSFGMSSNFENSNMSMNNMSSQGRTQFGDKEVINEALTTEKSTTSVYNTFVNECSNQQLRNDLLRILNNTHSVQAELFNEATNRGIYQPSQAQQQKISQAKQKYSTQSQGQQQFNAQINQNQSQQQRQMPQYQMQSEYQFSNYMPQQYEQQYGSSQHKQQYMNQEYEPQQPNNQYIIHPNNQGSRQNQFTSNQRQNNANENRSNQMIDTLIGLS